MKHGSGQDGDPLYISPGELKERWRCSRSSVDRIAARAGLARMFLGEGRHGMIRFLRSEVEAFEASRTVSASSHIMA